MKVLKKAKIFKRAYFANLQMIMIVGIAFCSLVLGITSSLAQDQLRPSPQNVKFLIKAVSGNEDSQNEKGKGKLVFKSGEKILIKTLIKNQSSEPLALTKTDWLYQYRFDVWEIGKAGVRAFRMDRAKLLTQRENDEGASSPRPMPVIQPGKSAELQTLNLEEIYDKLEPGKYKLVVYFRPGGLEYRRAKIRSNPLLLEIVP